MSRLQSGRRDYLVYGMFLSILTELSNSIWCNFKVLQNFEATTYELDVEYFLSGTSNKKILNHRGLKDFHYSSDHYVVYR